MKLRTKRNLMTVMQSGALDAAKYHRFAACARMDGEWDLATALQDAHNDGTQHFNDEAQLQGSIAHNGDNLRSAIDTRTKEMKLFAEFAREAIEDGDANVAALFNRISLDKAESCSRFQTILANMGVHSAHRNIKP
jgi:rubrerythrin